jgi:hypothetical protein
MRPKVEGGLRLHRQFREINPIVTYALIPAIKNKKKEKIEFFPFAIFPWRPWRP